MRYQYQPRGTNTPSLVSTDDNHDQTSDPIYCDSVKCSDGYAPVPAAADKECKKGVCTESQCCDMVCSSFDCPPTHSLVENANTTVLSTSGCTQKRCRQLGEKYLDNAAIVWRQY